MFHSSVYDLLPVSFDAGTPGERLDSTWTSRVGARTSPIGLTPGPTRGGARPTLYEDPS